MRETARPTWDGIEQGELDRLLAGAGLTINDPWDKIAAVFRGRIEGFTANLVRWAENINVAFDNDGANNLEFLAHWRRIRGATLSYWKGSPQMSQAALPSENLDFGFYGTMRQHGYDPAAAWAAAFPVIAGFWPVSHPRFAARRARLFLDSSGGRHLADAVAGTGNVALAVKRVLPSFYGWLR